MSWLTNLREGIAAVSASESGGVLTYRPATGYQPGECGIYGSVAPPDPAAAVSMKLAVLTEGIETDLVVQFRLRAPTDAQLDAIEDALTNSWVKRQNGSVGGVTVIKSEWSSGAPLGQDVHGRLQRSANYTITANRPLIFST